MPRFVYWTILLGEQPTSFRAKDAAELRPTLVQLQRKHPEAVLRWFERGRLWSSPDEARTALDAEHAAKRKRPPTWRPGGKHVDPRQKFIDAKKAKWTRFKERIRDRHEARQTDRGAPASARKNDERPPLETHDKPEWMPKFTGTLPAPRLTPARPRPKPSEPSAAAPSSSTPSPGPRDAFRDRRPFDREPPKPDRRPFPRDRDSRPTEGRPFDARPPRDRNTDRRPTDRRRDGERPPFGPKRFGAKPVGDRRPGGDRFPRDQRDRESKPSGDRRPFGDRPARDPRDRENRPPGDRRPGGDRFSRDSRDREQRPDSNRRGFEKPPPGDRRPPAGKPAHETRRPFSGKRTSDRRGPPGGQAGHGHGPGRRTGGPRPPRKPRKP